ncbi:ABC transporter permease subunit [Enterocloster clostridioformis]|uniref:ABC transporter permease n=1 Tax=Enterocloster clostridioformis TaxID=1531 RepID=UPI002675D5CB|nr:ABC transporter permease subunit [Enterocloster clostridioformis]
MKKKKETRRREPFSLSLMYKQRYLLLMSLPFVVWVIIFKYIPLWGWTMAFQEVKPKTFGLSLWERPFVGFSNFIKAFTDRLFAQTMINTIGISILDIAIGTAGAIIFAILLNEIRLEHFKKLTQTVSYLPHFVSWVIIASIAKMLLNDGGAIETLTGAKLHLMSTNSPLFWVVVCAINLWKEIGWNAIIYLSAIAGIDQGIYEAAKVDGANRFQRIWHITLPGIKPTAIVLLIMSVGSALNVGMERQMLLSNGIVQDHTMVLSWFAYVRGIGANDYGLGTAIGMFQSIVGIILLFLANKVAGMLGESKLV